MEAFLSALQRQDFEAASCQLAEDVMLRSPIAVEPFVGRAAVINVVKALLGIVDGFEILDVLEGPGRCAVFHRIQVGSHTVDGVDDMRLNADGLVQSVTVSWRPLPAIVSAQNRLAPLLALRLLELVEKE